MALSPEERKRRKNEINLRYYHRTKANRPEKVAQWRRSDRLGSIRDIESKLRRVQPGALVAWADKAKIRAIYERRNRLNDEAGEIAYEVDHIVPLFHPEVCGLHVEHNLRIITTEENKRKGNTFIPDNNADYLIFPTRRRNGSQSGSDL